MKQNRLYLFLALAFYAIGGAFNQAMAQSGPPQTVSGTVTDALGPITGVNVILHNQNNGTFTDREGQYRIMASPEDTLLFTYLGYKTVTMPVGNRTQINVKLQEEATALQEVEVNAGYYTVKERERTGNISRVTAKEIELQPVSNPLAALQGRMPGVNITQTSGVPGSGFNIQIRGQNSIAAGNDPLYIVDGIPYNSQTLSSANVSSGVVPRGNLSPLSAINNADIKSIEILKDADATSIYGSRGANGVVLITTKKGVAGKNRLDIHLNSSLGRIVRFVDLMNTSQYLEMRREAFINDGIYEYPINAYDVNGIWDQNRYTNWQKELIGHTSYRNSAQISFSGGSETTQFLLSGTYQDETSVFSGDGKYGKGSVHSNLGHRSLDERFYLNLSMNYVMEDNRLPSIDFTRQALVLPPNAPSLYGPEGNLNWENGTFNNPLAVLENKYRAQRFNMIANSIIGYRILPFMEVKVNLGYNSIELEEYRTAPHTQYNPSFGLDSNSSTIFLNDGNRRSWIIEPQLHLNHKWGRLAVDFLAGTTFQQMTSKQFSQIGSGFPNNSLIFDLSAANARYILSDSSTEYRYHAIFGRININWSGRYLINFTGRRDGSSRFGPDKRFANFGALGAAWIFSEEGFMSKNLPFISFGKLRASFGTTGNDQIGDYEYLDTYSSSGTNYDGATGLRPTHLYNPIFGWEENRKFEVGLEMGLWKDLFSLTASYYRNRSSNQLVGVPQAGITGFRSLMANLDATVQNSGLEFTLRTVNFQKNKITWTSYANISLPRTKLIAFPGLEGSTFVNTYVVGEPLGIQKRYRYAGLNTDIGQHMVVDHNGDGAISPVDDQQYLVDLSPNFYGGLGNLLQFGNWELDFLFQFKKQKAQNYLYNGILPGTAANQTVEVVHRWQEPGDEGPNQRYTTGADAMAYTAFINYSRSEQAISDASFIRLKNASISFNVPKKALKDIDCNIYFQTQNLFTITNFNGADPESLTGVLPPLRHLGLGIKLGF